jgi:two-component system, OmpR family, sensor histidine kinase QseC
MRLVSPWRSFRSRTLWAVLGTAFLIWALWALYLLIATQRDSSSLVDESIERLALQVMRALPRAVLTPGDTRTFDVTEATSSPSPVDDIHYQVWTASTSERRLLSRSKIAPEQPLNPSFEHGFARSTVNGQRWRVYTIADDTKAVLLQLGHSETELLASAVEEIGAQSRALLLLLLPTMLVLVAVSAWTMRPLRRLQAAVNRRDPSDESPLPIADLPQEVVPLVTTFNEMLERAKRTRESQQRFIADAAHELRTPLASLRLQAQVAVRMPDASQRQAALARLMLGIDRTTRVAEQLIDMSRVMQARPDSGTIILTAQFLGPMVEQVLLACRELAQRRCIRVQVLGGVASAPAVQAHAELMWVALRNVIDNALRYAPVGTAVLIDATTLAKGVELSVTDDGPGLTQTQREQALEPFVRLADSGAETGSGLGLSIVQRACQVQGIALRLSEAPSGRGLKVSLTMRRDG